MNQLNLTSTKKIKNLPYEMLEEVTKKILPTNINPKEISIAFRAILSLSQTNKKMHLFIQSYRIKKHIINVIGKNIQDVPRHVGKNFLRWQVLSNELDRSFLDRVFKEIQKIQTAIYHPLNNFQLIDYQAHNFAHHRVGDTMQPKTCLVMSLTFNRMPLPHLRHVPENRVEVRYPFGTMTISHLTGLDIDFLINALKTPFEGIFEKQRQVEGGLVQHLEKGALEGNEPFELIEDSYSRPPYNSAHTIEVFGNMTGLMTRQDVESKKGKLELVFSEHPLLFSCYQIHSDVLKSIFGRDRCDEEMTFLSQLFLIYSRGYSEETIEQCSRLARDRTLIEYLDWILPGSHKNYETLDNYLEIDRNYDYVKTRARFMSSWPTLW